MENAKSQSVAAGTIVPCTDTTVCARPFVAPNKRLLGAADDMYIEAAPKRENPNVNLGAHLRLPPKTY
jgi:hypothetical protein